MFVIFCPIRLWRMIPLVNVLLNSIHLPNLKLPFLQIHLFSSLIAKLLKRIFFILPLHIQITFQSHTIWLQFQHFFKKTKAKLFTNTTKSRTQWCYYLNLYNFLLQILFLPQASTQNSTKIPSCFSAFCHISKLQLSVQKLTTFLIYTPSKGPDPH